MLWAAAAREEGRENTEGPAAEEAKEDGTAAAMLKALGLASVRILVNA